jgi:hypothetical protein
MYVVLTYFLLPSLLMYVNAIPSSFQPENLNEQRGWDTNDIEYQIGEQVGKATGVSFGCSAIAGWQKRMNGRAHQKNKKGKTEIRHCHWTKGHWGKITMLRPSITKSIVMLSKRSNAWRFLCASVAETPNRLTNTY